jgi:hypothetical protein
MTDPAKVVIPGAKVVIPIHYDFASSLSYVAHRVMGRIAHRFEGVRFRWTPLERW